ncbi:MAG: hypothetical protein BAA04_12355 [Firmicutes bacterium ZCTH02-B6]|nr:MAG: hypothetical protein BAA04_12355 [Firmicutes bacterium ZCTH02-B6]
MAELYQYQGWDRDGKPVRGTIEVEEGQDLERITWRLRVQGVFITRLAPARESVPFFSLSTSRPRQLKAKEMAVFCRQLGVMLATGLSVVGALRILAAQQRQPAVRQAVERVIRRVSGGDPLSGAFSRARHIFPRMFIDMLEVGEKSGNLPAVLERLAVYYEREAKMRGDITQALAYPSVVFSFAVAATGVILFVVLPIFAQLFAELGAELPLITRMVLGLRDILARYFLIIVPLLALAAWAVPRWLRTESGRMVADGVTLRLPAVGALVSRVVFARFAHTLSLLFSSGIGMDEALASCQRVVANRVVTADIAYARDQMRQGRGLAEPLRESRSFPPMLVEMIGVGEETGALDQVLTQIATFYEQEVERAVKVLSSLLEPIIMVMLAVVVAIVLSSVFLPMFQIIEAI